MIDYGSPTSQIPATHQLVVDVVPHCGFIDSSSGHHNFGKNFLYYLPTQGRAVLALYRFIVGLLFWIILPILLPIVLLTGVHRRGLKERLAFYDTSVIENRSGDRRRLWIHAASIGEVRAAGLLIECLKEHLADPEFLVTTMTIHGRDFARQHLGSDIACHLAPLDVPYSVNRALAAFRPDHYVCLETELWPVLLSTLKIKGIPTLLINGRLSPRSISTYRRFKFLFAPVVQSFRAIGAISETDRQRFIEVGAASDLVVVTGNIKDDTRLPPNPERITATWSELLDLAPGVDVFIAGSTHSPEEELLLPLLKEFNDRGGDSDYRPATPWQVEVHRVTDERAADRF